MRLLTIIITVKIFFKYTAKMYIKDNGYKKTEIRLIFSFQNLGLFNFIVQNIINIFHRTS